MKERIEDLKLTRVNISIEEDCKEWYQFKAKSMGMSMANLMAFILSNYYENSLNQQAQRTLSEAMKSESVKETNDVAMAMIEALKGQKN